MNILKEVLSHEVFPAFGCTEPIAVAYASAVAASHLKETVKKLQIIVDPGVYKNGKTVNVPNTGGERGNLIAGVIGAMLASPELKMEIIKAATPDLVKSAREFILAGHADIDFDATKKDLFIDVRVQGDIHNVRVVISSSHTNLIYLQRDGEVLEEKSASGQNQSREPEYRIQLRKMKLNDLVQLAEQADETDLDWIRQGVEMNLTMAEEGQKLKKVGHYIAQLMQESRDTSDIISTSKVLTASASDGRMAGLPLPVMSSGGAGNQGVVAILVPYNVGQVWGISTQRILRSIVLSHLVNAYVKCFTGDLSVICGCAIAAGMGAAVALVYQKCQNDIEKMGLAVNTVVSDIGGVFCDGAKEGCAMKVVSSTDAAIRAAYLAINGLGVRGQEGMAGLTPEQTIQNLSRITVEGMASVNEIILEIMREKDHPDQ